MRILFRVLIMVFSKEDISLFFFISPDLWPPNSPDLNPVDYEIWAVMQRREYQRKIHTIDELVTFTFTLVLVLQGNVATKLRYGGKIFILVISHFFLIPTVK